MKDVTPEQLKKDAEKEGVLMSIEQAEKIIKFLTMLAEIVVDNYLICQEG